MKLYKYNILFFFILILNLISVNAVLNDAIGSYSMDDADITGGDDYIDQTGGGDTIIATGTPTTGQTGKLNEAVDLSGSGQYYTCSGCHSVSGSDYTLVAWVNLDTTTGQHGIMTKFSGTSSTSEYIMQNLNGQLLCSYGDSISATHTTGLTAGNWTMVSCRFDTSNGNITACVSLSCTSTTDASISSGTSGNFQLGGRNGASTLLNGKIDQNMIYDRKLSLSELSDLENNRDGLDPYASAPASPFFQVTAQDLDTSATLYNISVILDNGTIYTNESNAVVNTNINDSGIYNITVYVNNYFNITFLNYNTSADLQANMSEFPKITAFDNWAGGNLAAFNMTVHNYTCLQETANLTGCLFTKNTGNYTTSSSGDTDYYDVTYIKPDDVRGAIWQVKHGTLSTYNITLSDACFNYNNDYVYLRFESNIQQNTATQYSSFSTVKCKTGASTYTEIGTTDTASGQYSSVTQTGTGLWYDEDYNTGVLDTCSQVTSSGDTDLCETARIYEDSIFWLINKSYEVTDTTLYLPINTTENLTFQVYGYWNVTTNYNLANSNDLNQSIIKPHISVISYGNLTVYNNTNYTRILNYNLTIDGCLGNITYQRYINGSINQSTVLTCSSENQTVTGLTFRASEEGRYIVGWDSIITGANIGTPQNTRGFISDLVNPVVLFDSGSIQQGFTDGTTTTVALQCEDNIAPISYYNLTINSNFLFSGYLPTGTNQSNSTELADGENTVIGICGDFFKNVTETDTFTAYAKTIYIVNEITGEPFDYSNVTNLKLWFDDNSSFFDFKNNGSSTVDVIGVDLTRLRLEIEYSNSDIITRYVNLLYMPENNATLCANLEGVTHYEQLAISSSSVKPVVVQNQFTNCYVAADLTRFVYQGAFSLPFFTINSIYYLYTFDNGQQVLLSSLEGSLQTVIDLDNLEFSLESYNVQVLTDVLSFQRIDDDTTKIYYKNFGTNKTSQNLLIYRTDTGSLLSNISSFTDPNEFTYYFYYNGSLSNQTIVYKIVLTSVDVNGITTVKTQYFNKEGSSGFIPSVVGLVAALVLIIFGVTLTRPDFSFGFFGVFVYLGALGVLAFSISAWYITFMQAVVAISLLYSIITLFLGGGQKTLT